MLRLRTIVWWNLLLVAGTGVYGLVTDEPYWRANGHSPSLYDYLYWCALALNGPSGFIAALLPQLVIPQDALDGGFLAQYGLWLLFIPAQWWCYERAAAWGLASRARKTSLLLIAGSIATAGCAAAYYAWVHAPLDEECASSSLIYGGIMHIIALALSGLVLLAYGQLAVLPSARTNGASG